MSNSSFKNSSEPPDDDDSELVVVVDVAELIAGEQLTVDIELDVYIGVTLGTITVVVSSDSSPVAGIASI